MGKAINENRYNMKKATNENIAKAEKRTVEINLKWGDFDKIPSQYVNHMVVTFSGKEFYMIFGELCSPPFPEIAVEKGLTIEPRAKLVINPDAMKDISKLLYDYVKKLNDEEGDND